MRTLLVVLTLCYVVDALAFEGRYLSTTAELVRSESASISAKTTHTVSSWLTPG
jgi:hypothetical protein